MLSDATVDKDNAKVGLFIAAAIGTFALMAAVYCIYNKFYTKQQYLHTQLNDDSGRSTNFHDMIFEHLKKKETKPMIWLPFFYNNWALGAVTPPPCAHPWHKEI